MWIFGYGALMWKFSYPYKLKKYGYVRGYCRKFYLLSMYHRGTSDCPGRVATIVPSKSEVTWGIAYEVDDQDDIHEELKNVLDEGYQKILVDFYPVSLKQLAATSPKLMHSDKEWTEAELEEFFERTLAHRKSLLLDDLMATNLPERKQANPKQGAPQAPSRTVSKTRAARTPNPSDIRLGNVKPGKHVKFPGKTPDKSGKTRPTPTTSKNDPSNQQSASKDKEATKKEKEAKKKEKKMAEKETR